MPKPAPGKYLFKGADGPRARALSRSVRRPKFALGEVLIDAHGDIGAIDSIYADLQAVEDAGVIDVARSWLAELELRPKTPASGIWYGLVYGHGAGVVGELDVRRAPPATGSKP